MGLIFIQEAWGGTGFWSGPIEAELEKGSNLSEKRTVFIRLSARGDFSTLRRWWWRGGRGIRGWALIPGGHFVVMGYWVNAAGLLVAGWVAFSRLD